MNKHFLTLLALSLVTTGAMAQFTGPGGTQVSTVAQVAQARHGADVTLEGHVVERQRDDYYTFRDATGDIRVEIDKDVWRGRQVGPEQKVRITGEVDHGWRGRYIDVDKLDLI